MSVTGSEAGTGAAEAGRRSERCGGSAASRAGVVAERFLPRESPLPPLASSVDPRASRGFTLIEILVVLVIVAVVAVALTLSISGNAERRLADEAGRFRALAEQACHTAELTGREIGTVLDAGGYRFQRLDGAQWREFGEGEFRPRQWPQALRLELARNGRPLQLATAERSAPQLVCFSSGELTPFSLTLALGDAPLRYRISGREDGGIASERLDAPR